MTASRVRASTHVACYCMGNFVAAGCTASAILVHIFIFILVLLRFVFALTNSNIVDL